MLLTGIELERLRSVGRERQLFSERSQIHGFTALESDGCNQPHAAVTPYGSAALVSLCCRKLDFVNPAGHGKVPVEF